MSQTHQLPSKSAFPRSSIEIFSISQPLVLLFLAYNSSSSTIQLSTVFFPAAPGSCFSETKLIFQLSEQLGAELEHLAATQPDISLRCRWRPKRRQEMVNI